jgi:hypothetical protein
MKKKVVVKIDKSRKARILEEAKESPAYEKAEKKAMAKVYPKMAKGKKGKK